MLTLEKREALLKVRHLIECGQEFYICWALQAVARRNSHLFVTCGELEEFVVWSLGGRDKEGFSPSLCAWQKRNGWGNRSVPQGRQDRLDWLDWMLNDNPPDPVQVSLAGVGNTY
jgi:hypothetical protein